MEFKHKFCAKIFILHAILVLLIFTGNGYGLKLKRFRRPGIPPPPPVVKVGKEVISIKAKPTTRRNGAQTVDIAPLLAFNEKYNSKDITSSGNFNSRNFLNHNGASSSANADPGVLILRRKTPKSRSRSMNVFRGPTSSNIRQQYPIRPELPILSFQQQQNRRSFDTHALPPLSNSRKAKLAWMALQLQEARKRQRAMRNLQHYDYGLETGKSQYYRSLIPLLYHYKLQKQAANKYYAKYLKTLQLLALATSQSSAYTSSPELSSFTQSFQNSPYKILLNNSSFIPTDSVNAGTAIKFRSSNNKTNIEIVEDQIAEASERSDTGYEYTSLQREIEKQKRRLLEVFPPPQSEIPFGERTILMVRFPPVPNQDHDHHHDKGVIKLSKEYNIDGGITFGGPRWRSFGTPFDPFDHPWYHTTKSPKGPSKLVLKEADKSSSYGVIITQSFIHRPSIRFTNSDPKSLAKHKGDLLNGGPSIVTQLAKALAEGNRISNSYFLSKNLLQGKKWASPETKPPFVIVHLDTYTKKSNETGSFGIDEQVQVNYANGTVIYPTKNDPHILASTKFEFHNAKEIDHIFHKPLAILGHGYGWGQVPVYPKGINEIKNFLRLMYKVHQETHDLARKKSDQLKWLGDKLERPAFNNSKPLLRDQIAERSINWLHTSSVGIRSLSEDDDHFPDIKHPVVDVSEDYGHFL